MTAIELSSPPRLSGGVPWLGHAAAFSRDPVSFLRSGRDRVGDVFSFTLLGRRVVFLAGPRAHRAVFSADDELLSSQQAYRFMVPVFGEGVAYGAEPAVMDSQLGLVLGALTARRLQAYASVMAAEADTYLDSWGETGVVDLYDAMNELTVAIASHCLIGTEFRSRLTGELPGLYHDLEGGIRLAGLVNPYLPLPPFRRRDRARTRISEVIRGIIAERRRDAGRAAGEDMLATLMAAANADGSPLADDVIAGILLALIFAGQHTSAVLSTWTGLLLLDHPEHLAEVRAEQDLLGVGGPSITLAKVHQMAALERCVKEAEQMHPPLVVLMRMTLGEFCFDGYRIPPGVLVMISPGVSHRFADVFREPDTYDPARFGPGREEDRRTPYSLIGFGGGKHRCVGLAFAHLQIKVIWSVLLRRFELSLPQPPNPPDYSTFVAGPRRPCLVSYRRARPGERP